MRFAAASSEFQRISPAALEREMWGNLPWRPTINTPTCMLHYTPLNYEGPRTAYSATLATGSSTTSTCRATKTIYIVY